MIEHHLLELVTPPAQPMLMPVATVRSYLGLSDSSQDTTLARLIRALSRAFAGVDGLRREPLRATWIEKTIGDGGPRLVLHRWPVESVSSVTLGAVDPQTIDSSEYSIAGVARRQLYRTNLWAAPWPGIAAAQAGGGELYDYAVTYTAGWLPPGSGAGTVSTWAAATVYAAGAFVKRLTGSGLYLFEATTGGTSHAATEPTWPSTAGGTVTDGTVTWTARRSEELPEDIQEIFLVALDQLYSGGLDIPAGVQAESADGFSVQYDFVAARTLRMLSPTARAVLTGYR